MSIPKENRQQMINLMYLVLTALLALNVSAEILNAFRVINSSLIKSNVILDNNVQTTFKAFAAKKAKEPANQQITLYETRSQQVLTLSAQLEKDIKSLQDGIITQAGGPGEEGAPMRRQDDLDASTRYFVGEKNDQEGYKLAKKIQAYRQALLTLVAPEDTATVAKEKIAINTNPQKKNGDWVTDNFYQMPAIASMTMLTKMLTDTKTTESQMVNYFYQKLGDATPLEPTQIIMDKFSAQITAPSSYILKGDQFEANVFLSATNSKSNNVKVTVNGSNLPVGADGFAKYSSAPGVGEYTLNGDIAVINDRTGKVDHYPLPPYKYTVAAPFATVSPTKMNVFYIGVDNPVEVSAAGASAADLKVGITSGSISGSGGKYSVRVTTQGTTAVTVNAKGKAFPNFPFRVKLIPNPVAKVSGMPGGRINAAVWKAQKGVIADLENFDFDAKFEVLSFNMFYQPKLQDPGIASATGPYFSAAMQAFVSKAKPGDIFYIEEIKVKGPDGLSRKIPGIAFKID